MEGPISKKEEQETGAKKKLLGQRWSLRRMMSRDTRMWPRLSGLFRWKTVDHLKETIMDDVVFKVVSAAETVVLVSALCFFLLCCGGHI